MSGGCHPEVLECPVLNQEDWPRSALGQSLADIRIALDHGGLPWDALVSLLLYKSIKSPIHTMY